MEIEKRLLTRFESDLAKARIDLEEAWSRCLSLKGTSTDQFGHPIWTDYADPETLIFTEKLFKVMGDFTPRHSLNSLRRAIMLGEVTFKTYTTC